MAAITSAFDDLTVEIITGAFDDACRHLPPSLAADERELLAKRILGTAALGERDPQKMRDDAIAYFES